MGRPRRSDLTVVLDFAVETEAIPDLQAVPTRLLAGLRRLAPASIASCVEFRTGSSTAAFSPPDPLLDELVDRFPCYMDEHPRIAHLKRTGDESVEYQIAMFLGAAPRRRVALSLDRYRPHVSERDRLILNLLPPHLSPAHESALARTHTREWLSVFERALESSGRAVVILRADGRIEPTVAARRLLAAYLGRTRYRGDSLPRELERWLRRERRGSNGDSDVPRLPEPFVVERPYARLVVRFLAGGKSGGPDVLLLEEQERPSTGELRRFGLTLRQAEVLELVVEGRTNDEIARLLFVSRRTVEKHLEHIYDRLGVRTRTAAVALTGRARGGAEGPGTTLVDS